MIPPNWAHRAKDLRGVGELFAALALVTAPHMARLPIWVFAALLGLGIWRLRREARGEAAPGKAVLVALTAAAVAGVVATARRPIDRDAFLTLLVVLSGLKLLEMRTRRDRHIGVFLTLFLVLAGFLYGQSIPSALYLGGVVVFVTAAWIDLAREGPARPVGLDVRLAAKLLGQAVPIAIVVFALFPRVTGRLWGLPQDYGTALSGLSDRMSPGSISSVALSDAVAFRVEFQGRVPAPAERYWRGPVFEATDGVEWWDPSDRAGSGRPAAPPAPAKGDAPGTVEYAVTLEPHGKHWMFGLDVPVSAPEGSFLALGSVLWSRSPVRERLRYAARSRLGARAEALSPEARSQCLSVPAASARVRSLAEAWRIEAPDGEGIVERSLDHFRNEGFVYSLAPPRLGPDPVGEFLFETRQGFCEHFAGAFAVLMRLAGVPARVVTGYQGGELNPLGEYLVVRQAHAHAWAEVWLPRSGWVRVDPTAAVAPDRVELPIDNTLLSAGASVRFVLPPSHLLLKGLHGLRHLWDAANNGWNQWVLGYGPKRQSQLLSRLGFGNISWAGMTALLVAASALALAGAALQTARQVKRSDPVQRAYGRFCRKLGARGLGRLPHEGPSAYADRVCAARANLDPDVRAITGLYLRLRYGPPRGSLPEDLRELRARVRRLRA